MVDGIVDWLVKDFLNFSTVDQENNHLVELT